MTLTRLSRDRRALSTDWLWGGVGLSIAGVSASFAAYMIATAPSVVTGSGSKDFMIFARLDRRSPAPAIAEAAARPDERASATAPAGSAIDPEPTGSIAPSTRADPKPGRPPNTSATDLRDYILRDVIGDKALIEHRQRLSLVKPGSILGEAGEVLAIERRGTGWIVKTVSGDIGGT